MENIWKTDAEVEVWEADRFAGLAELKKIKKHIDKKSTEPINLFSFEPTTFTRSSPFFPMSRRQMGNREFDKALVFTHSWGKITLSGERLSIYDETVLLALLLLFREKKRHTFRTTRYEICTLLDVKPATNTYAAIWNSIRRMTKTSIEIEIKNKVEIVGTILAGGISDLKTEKLTITINPYFSEMFEASMITQIDVKFRTGLKGDLSKALYRFFQGQAPLYNQGKYSIDIIKLCRAVNLQTEGIEKHRLRSMIREGLRSLEVGKYLSSWELSSTGLVSVWRGTIKQLAGHY